MLFEYVQILYYELEDFDVQLFDYCIEFLSAIIVSFLKKSLKHCLS